MIPVAEWTDARFTCSHCGRPCRLSRTAIDAARQDWAPPELSDAEVAAGFDECLSCGLVGEDEPGERIYPEAYLIVPGEGFDDVAGTPTTAGTRYWAIDDETEGVFGLIVSGPVPEGYVHG